jgi:hypothetical protein
MFGGLGGEQCLAVVVKMFALALYSQQCCFTHRCLTEQCEKFSWDV